MIRKYDRFLIPARLTNGGGFSHETIYQIDLIGGVMLRHIGFTNYTFDENKVRNQDEHWQGEKAGYVEVIVYEVKDRDVSIIPPQAHGCDSSGMVIVRKGDLLEIPRSQWNDRDQYGVKDVGRTVGKGS